MDILVSTDWIADNLDVEDLVLLDASSHLPSANRDPLSDFTERHIPGARFLDLPGLKDETSPVPAALPRADQFDARMQALGVKQTDRVVLYDDSMLRSSARAYFIFDMFGFDKVALLDGGFGKWIAEGRDIVSGTPEAGSSHFRSGKDDRRRVRDKTFMLENCRTCSEQVVDARDAARFCGDEADAVHGLPGGHIPGARNLFFRELLNEDGTFKGAGELRGAFDKAGIDLDRSITASCGSGMTASVVLFALELLNRKGALYDGSWSEWGSDPDTPKEQGQAR